MIEVFPEQYIQFLGHIQILLKNPTESIPVGILRALTLILVVIFLGKHLYSSFAFTRLRKQFRKCTVTDRIDLYRLFRVACQKTGIKRIPDLYIFSDARPLIFAAGIISPSVFIAPGITEPLSERELEAALIHELQHIKRRDALYVVLVDIISAAIPALTVLLCGFKLAFEPVMSWLIMSASILMIPLFRSAAKRRIIMARELSCDDQTISIVKDPLLLAGALVKVWQFGSNLPKFSFRYALSNAQPFFTADHEMTKRVTRLMDYRTPVVRKAVIRTVGALTLSAVVYLSVNIYQLNDRFGEAGIIVGKNHMQIRLQHNSGNMTQDLLIRKSPLNLMDREDLLHEEIEDIGIFISESESSPGEKQIEVKLSNVQAKRFDSNKQNIRIRSFQEDKK